MKYECTLLAVSDMVRAKQFYCQLLGMEVTADFGANITLSNVISLQTLESWQGFVNKPAGEIRFGHNAAELYFEEDDLDVFLEKLANWPNIHYVHPLKEHRWGQRVVRLYDPDGHIVEVGENMAVVVRRFLAGGMTVAETARRMEVPEAFILANREDVF
ncbi:VOC family protein [Oscillospiraceae bacterium LTW-04]|nr:VOC family protein [Oscillospiraceae bacterium MB24-C1]